MWNGNSDNSLVSTPDAPVFSIEVTTFVWQGFLNEATATWGINNFAEPDGLVHVEVDAWTGIRPTTGSRSVEEVFIAGTEPTSAVPVGVCGSAVFEYTSFEKNHENWLRADRNWFERARRGPGTAGGVNGTRTAFFYNGQFKPYGNSWGIVEGFRLQGRRSVADVHPVAEPGRERPDPIVRNPDS